MKNRCFWVSGNIAGYTFIVIPSKLAISFLPHLQNVKYWGTQANHIFCTFLEAELVLATSLEVVQCHEQLRIILFLCQQVFLRGPSVSCVQRQWGSWRSCARSGTPCTRLAGTPRHHTTPTPLEIPWGFAIGQVRDVRQRTALQQCLCRGQKTAASYVLYPQRHQQQNYFRF